MGRLIRAEFFKLKKMPAFRVLLAAYFVFEVLFTANEIGNSVLYSKYNSSFTGVEWFCQTPGITGTGYYAIAVFIFAAFFVAGEFTGRTFYTGFLCGRPRGDVFWAKIIAFTVGAGALLLIHILTGTVLWTLHSGFGMEFGGEMTPSLVGAALRQMLEHMILASHAILFSMAAKKRVRAFGLSYGVLYILGLPFWHTSLYSDMVVFTYIDYLQTSWETSPQMAIPWVAGVILMLLAASYLFVKSDLK